jgi:hypothetical protein
MIVWRVEAALPAHDVVSIALTGARRAHISPFYDEGYGDGSGLLRTRRSKT